MQSAKQATSAMLRSLPEDASFEDIQYRLYVLDKIAAGLGSLDVAGGVAHEDVKRRMEKWLPG